MTKEKTKTDFARSALCILAALAFGAYLGSPVPKVWAEPVSAAMAVVLERITEIENLHNEPNEPNEPKNDEAAAEDKTSESAEDKVNPEADKTISPAGITSADPAAAEGETDADPAINSAEAQPDYICVNANRGGAADRKEMDVLVHLINAEAYGLSYKAKVAVGQVVMNRWTGPYYGDDLLAIMTAPYQFTPIHNGSAFKKEIEADSIKAANAVLNGSGVTELTDDTYYFVNPDFTEDKTIETEMEFVCEIEGLHFYRPPGI